MISLIKYHIKNIFNIFPAAEKETQKTNIQQVQYGIKILNWMLKLTSFCLSGAPRGQWDGRSTISSVLF